MTDMSLGYSLLGKTIVDAITGIEGVCTQVIEYHTGTIQCCIQPKGDGRTVPESYYIDPNTLSIVEDGYSVTPVPVPNPTNYLNKKVKDKINGAKGIATKRIINLNGCEQYVVMSDTLERGKAIAHIVPTQDLECKEADKPVEPVRNRVGGPIQKAYKF